MDPATVIPELTWVLHPMPAQQDPSRVQEALYFIAEGESESAVSWSVAALEDAVGNSHAAVLYPVAGPASAVMLAVAGHWRNDARAQALISLLKLLETEVLPGFECYERDGILVSVEQEIRDRILSALPMLRSIAEDKQPWRHNRKLARELITLVAA